MTQSYDYHRLMCDIFSCLLNAEDVADLLSLELRKLTHILYGLPASLKYTEFCIQKKSGGMRTITAPIGALKLVQRRLNTVLQEVYKTKPSVHGFVYDKNVVTNALGHVPGKTVLCLDLKDFFPTINFGRVRGMFMGSPYNIAAPAATVIAQICCFNNALPQGAPTSPAVSNMLCGKLDSQLTQLAKNCHAYYTRYADDITFSTDRRGFPSALARQNAAGQVLLGAELYDIIVENGFQVNHDKVRLQPQTSRQQVTGIVVNERTNVRRRYVRQIRAMLHAWGKYDLEAAQDEFRRRWDRKDRISNQVSVDFAQVVKGKIEYLGMVRGSNDFLYNKLLLQLKAIAPAMVKRNIDVTLLCRDSLRATVFTEGKTDWKYLTAALRELKRQRMYQNLDLEFTHSEADIGSKVHLEDCRKASRRINDKSLIFVFDSDDDPITKMAATKGKPFRDWGNSVVSVVLPIPSHRQGLKGVSTELYFTDQDLKRTDKNGRRLYLSDEFQPITGRHLNDPSLIFTRQKKLEKPLFVVSDSVHDKDARNVALTKSDFANLVLNASDGFNEIDFSAFSSLFDVIVQVLLSQRPEGRLISGR